VSGAPAHHLRGGAVPGVAYDPAADRRSFSATSGFFADVFAREAG
jgi:hypothetical protein